MVGKKSHTKKKLRKEMTAAIGDEEEYVKEKKKFGVLVHGVCAESSIDKTAGRNGFVWLLGAHLLSCI
jgi:hypothetical protein